MTYLNSALRLSSLKLEQLTTKILKQNSNSHKGVELWAKTEKHKTISGISYAIFPARHPRKSSQHVRACAENRKIFPYHGANPNTRNGARLRSPSPIMAPGSVYALPSNYKAEKQNGVRSRLGMLKSVQTKYFLTLNMDVVVFDIFHVSWRIRIVWFKLCLNKIILLNEDSGWTKTVVWVTNL